MARLYAPEPRPPSPVKEHWATWRCQAPVGDGVCGSILTGWERPPVEGPPTRAYRTWKPGPVVRHLPCGHQWWVTAKTWLPDDLAPEALAGSRR